MNDSNHTLCKGEDAHSMRLLPEEFVPSEFDVICGRGRRVFNHIGNERFRQVVATYLERYQQTTQKHEKSYILSEIVVAVRRVSPSGGGFVKKDSGSGRWYEVGDFLAREKTSQAFRDLLHEHYRSSNLAKKKRRHDESSPAARGLERAHSVSALNLDSSAKPKASRIQLSKNSISSQAGIVERPMPKPTRSSESPAASIGLGRTPLVTPQASSQSACLSSSLSDIAAAAAILQFPRPSIAGSDRNPTLNEADEEEVDDPLYFEILRGDANDERAMTGLLRGEILSPVKQRRRTDESYGLASSTHSHPGARYASLNQSCPTLSFNSRGSNHSKLDRYSNSSHNNHLFEIEDDESSTTTRGSASCAPAQQDSSLSEGSSRKFDWFSNSLTSVTEESDSGDYAIPFSPDRQSTLSNIDFSNFPNSSMFTSPLGSSTQNGSAFNKHPLIGRGNLSQVASTHKYDSRGASKSNSLSLLDNVRSENSCGTSFDLISKSGRADVGDDEMLFARLAAVTSQAPGMTAFSDPFEPVPFGS
jgi:hypothetical protein